jgi:hypothetical protein
MQAVAAVGLITVRAVVVALVEEVMEQILATPELLL